MKHWIIVSVIAIIVGVLSQCTNFHSESIQIGPYTSNQFNALNREQQIRTCATCHQEQHENEQLGPHAHSYRSLEHLDSYLSHPDYHLGFYKELVESSREVQCMGCHAPVPLYTDLYKDHLTAPDSLIESWYSAKPALPKARSTGRNTGVDCITCHYDGQRVVTSSDFVSDKYLRTETTCSPLPSAFFASDYNCYGCHSVTFEDRHKDILRISDGTGQQSTSCIGCHQEYDIKGRPTHYFYWKHDPPSKQKPDKLRDFFKPEVVRMKGGSIELNWVNILMPHPMSRAPEYFLDYYALTENGDTIASERRYINRKAEHDRTMTRALGRNVLPGVFGFDPIHLSDTLKTGISIPKKYQAERISVSISAYSKSQYWHHDSLGVLQWRGDYIVNYDQ